MPLARRILPVTIVDFCYGWTLWLFLSWIPTFFLENYHLNLQSSAMFSAGVLFAGVVGDTVGGVVSDRMLRRTGSLIVARRSVIVAGFLGAFVFLIPVVLIHDLTVAAICLSLAFFFAELIVAPIWSVPMDIAPGFAGIGQRDDEFRIWGGGADFAVEFRVAGRSDGKLGGAVYWIDRVAAGGGGASVATAAGCEV